MILSPSLDYRYAFRRGMNGTDVAALQINLWVQVDGDFGRQTQQAVVRFQQAHGLVDDGVAGPVTQQALCVERSTPAARFYGLPVGMAKSLMGSESGFFVAAVSYHPSDAGLDVGAYQRSSGPGPGSQEFYRSAYDIAHSADVSLKALRDERNQVPAPVPSRYLNDLAGASHDRFKWQMAILSHNWPYAAYHIPRRGHIFTDPARDDQPASWIQSASGNRLSTPRQWVESYVARATVFVRWP